MRNLTNQKGSALLEGLVAVMIFSFGLLGIAGFQMSMTKQTTNIQYRLEASSLVSSAMGDMEADATQVACYTTTPPPAGCERAVAWFAKVATMPGAATHTPTISTNASKVTTITVFWSLPKENDLLGNAVVHNVKAQVAPMTGIL
jgi:type IV pilus assembly protein PilV